MQDNDTSLRLTVNECVQVVAGYVDPLPATSDPLKRGGPYGVIIEDRHDEQTYLVAVECIRTDGQICEQQLWYEKGTIE